MQPTITPQAFVTKWRQSKLKERSAYQAHFDNLCQLIGHPTPTDADMEGTSFTYEAGATKQKGGSGWADVWKKGYFAWEYKGRDGNLDKAYQQVQQYREALLNPPLLVVCDFDQIVVHTNFTNTIKKQYVITLDDLLTPDGMRQLRAIFYEPEAFRAPVTTDQVTREAAAEFAKLADQFRKWKEDPQRTAHFLIRLLFCLFAEDVELLPPSLFSRMLDRGRTDTSRFTRQLQQLFDAMSTGGDFGVDAIRHFNGGLFNDSTVLPLDSDALAILTRVSRLDWSSIEPSIFGTLFERSLDPGKRSQLGAHYTSRDDILLIVEPVLMAPSRRKWADLQEKARDLATRRDAASGGQQTRLANELRSILVGFAQELAQLQVLDPACGSGNFLYVALKQLLDLEKEVITFAGDIGVGTFFPSVSPEQLHGIEVNEYAYELAQVTVWIGYIQWLRDNGFGAPSEPILKSLETIHNMDAVLAFDEQDKPYEPVWPKADVIIGNPPFLGGKRLRTELGDRTVDALFTLYDGRVPREADLVTYWFERARELIDADQTQRAGLLSTQSIRAGANRRILEHVKDTGDIFMAWSDRPWILDGAQVRVSMIGFDDGRESVRTLDGHQVQEIYANLTGALDLTKAHRLHQNLALSYMGDTKGGSFDIDADVAARMIAAPLNPNGRSNIDVVRPWVNGLDVTRRPRDMWIIDFGVAMTEEDAALYEVPFAYVQREVKPERDKNNRASYRERWWVHVEPRPAMREAIGTLTRYLATPRVARQRIFVWIVAQTLPDSRLYVFTREDDYFFGLLQSHIHEVWALATSSRHGVGNDPTYNNTTCFETFPFPWSPGKEPVDDPRVRAIAAAAKRLVELRDNWLNPPGADEAELKKRTLTNLYNQRPTWLDNAHKKLDAAVLDAYDWPHDISDEDILARLLALNLERAAAQGSVIVRDVGDDD